MKTMTYEQLEAEEENGRAYIVATAYEGTCQLWRCEESYWVVLPDNTVISHEEDNAAGSEDAIFPEVRKAKE